MENNKILGLNSDQLKEFYPFHFILDDKLKILQMGNVLEKLMPNNALQSEAKQFFEIIKPSHIDAFEEFVEHKNTIIIVQLKTKKLRIKGQVACFNEHNYTLFIGSPQVNDIAQLKEMGLTILDFPIHDSVSDYLFLIQTKNTILQDNKKLIEQLSNQKKELIELNKSLEAKVKFRTNELENNLIKLQDTQSQLIQSEKMASLGGMVAGIAHEINTPVGMALTGITHLKSETQELETLFQAQEMTQTNFEDFINDSIILNTSIANNLQKAANLVKSFKQVAVDQSSDEDREFNLKEYIEEILTSIQNETKKTKHNIIVEIPSDIRINSNPGAFSQIITNFIMNSIIHAFDKDEIGEIKISASFENNILTLIYKDNGKGLTKEGKNKIFDPFYTTNRGGGGSGLGMNIVFNIITQKLNGTIAILSEIGDGIEFKITI